MIVEQGDQQFRQRPGERLPVRQLNVLVVVVVRGPGRLVVPVPDTLEVGWPSPGPRARDEQVPTEYRQQLDETHCAMDRRPPARPRRPPPSWGSPMREVERRHEALMLLAVAAEHLVVVDRPFRPGLEEQSSRGLARLVDMDPRAPASPTSPSLKEIVPSVEVQEPPSSDHGQDAAEGRPVYLLRIDSDDLPVGPASKRRLGVEAWIPVGSCLRRPSPIASREEQG